MEEATRDPVMALPSPEELDYELPHDRIAVRPLEVRDEAKLLVSEVVKPGAEDALRVLDCRFKDLPTLLPPETLMVMNHSRVITARLPMTKDETGGKAEVLCVSPVGPSADPAMALQARSGEAVWRCLIGGKRIKPGSKLRAEAMTADTGEKLHLTAHVEERSGQDGVVRFTWDGGPPKMSFATVLEAAGKVPLPPYLARPSDDADKRTYQTVYAKQEGSVAAPTAGLHFTERLLQRLRGPPLNTSTCFLTLHVGAGTFQPVSGDSVADHRMHWERVSVTSAALDQLIEACDRDRPIVPVGTTSTRTLESLYWWGAAMALGGSAAQDIGTAGDLKLSQWAAYRLGATSRKEVPVKTALEFLRSSAEKDGLSSISGETQLMIAPGYRFALCDGLITNFHQPRSTLLLLVGALMGGLKPVHRLYLHALRSSYRFLSYGDANLMLPPSSSLLPARGVARRGGLGAMIPLVQRAGTLEV